MESKDNKNSGVPQFHLEEYIGIYMHVSKIPISDGAVSLTLSLQTADYIKGSEVITKVVASNDIVLKGEYLEKPENTPGNFENFVRENLMRFIQDNFKTSDLKHPINCTFIDDEPDNFNL